MRLPPDNSPAGFGRAWILFLLACFGPLTGLQAQKPPRSAPEEQVRAAFLYQLALYVTWPGDAAREPLRFCILGNDHLAEILDSLVLRKRIQDRSLTVRKISAPDQLASCHVAFLAIDRRKQLQQILARWSYPPVLLVGEMDGFAESGGMVNLRTGQGHVQMEINLQAARRAGLLLRSQLLQLARIVAPEELRP